MPTQITFVTIGNICSLGVQPSLALGSVHLKNKFVVHATQMSLTLRFLYVGHDFSSRVRVSVHAELIGSVSDWQGCLSLLFLSRPYLLALGKLENDLKFDSKSIKKGYLKC